MPQPIIGNDPTGTIEFDALIARLKSFIAAGHGEIFAQLTVEEHEIIIALCYHNELGADILAQQLRHFATVTLEGAQRWSERKATRAIKFKFYLEQAAAWRAAVQRNAAQIINLADRRGQRARGALAELNPSVMVNMSSPRLRAVGLLRQHREGRIWADTFSNQFMTDWNGTNDGAVIAPRRMDDEFYLNVALWLAAEDEKLGGISVKPLTIDCVHTAAGFDKRNAPRDFLNGLAWDGVERLESVFPRGYGADDSAFNRAAGRCWFVSMVARIMRPGCQLDTMPVLIGPQGIFKTQSLRVIGGAWYREAQSSIHNKDFLQELWGALVFEIQELHSLVTSNAAAAKVKAVISTQVDHFRKSYGYAPGEFRRTACMVGTTNNRDWHHDETGGRRFWPIHCGVIDMEWIRANRCQLFAEARVYFDLPDIAPSEDGSAQFRDPRSLWWNVPIEAQRDLMDAETGEDAWENIIVGQLDRTDANAPHIFGRDESIIDFWDGTLTDSTAWGNLLTVQRIAIHWLRLNTEQAGKRITANRIGAIMRHLGWHRVLQRVHGTDKRVRVWLPTPNECDAPSAAGAGGSPPPVTDDDDIPF